jgi:hypothetical protein
MGRLYLVLLSLIALPLQAGTYKCIGPDGAILYQQGPCAESSQGGELRVDTRPPGGPNADPGSKDLSVEGQLRTLESARAKERKARTGAAKATRDKSRGSGRDRAKCAKHRAQAARWQEEVRNGYRTQEEKQHNEHMLEYHQVLVGRYCEPS